MFSNLWSNSYISCLLLIITLCFTCGERKIWLNIKKFQNIMSMIEDNECTPSAILVIFLAFFLWLIMFHVARYLMAAIKLVWIPFVYLFVGWFIYPICNKVLNLKLNNLKFIFVCFYLLISAFAILFSPLLIYI